ncbi:MAG: fructose,6-bisphosphatase [Desulfovibrionales bacterium]|nr:fructose,6-bisphosphatase [Desulfovibrionales bacterium]
MPQEAPQRNLALDLLRVTESAAMASARWLGKGDGKRADGAAVEAMRTSFNAMNMSGVVVIGEGEKDRAPMLFNGEAVGDGKGPGFDVAVDPVEGTKLLAFGRPNAISVVALAPRGTMYDPGPCFYMRKLVVPPQAKDAVDIMAPVEDNLKKTAAALDKDVDDLVVFVLDKPRHQGLIQEIRKAGARIQLHTDGDVAGSLMAVTNTVDMMIGTGGTPEGVLSAAAIRGLGGEMQGYLDPQSEEERRNVINAGYDLKRVLRTEDLVASDDTFFAATGISGGTFLKGVQFTGHGAETYSMVIRGKTGAYREIKTRHNFEKLMAISSIDYD